LSELAGTGTTLAGVVVGVVVVAVEAGYQPQLWPEHPIAGLSKTENYFGCLALVIGELG